MKYIVSLTLMVILGVATVYAQEKPARMLAFRNEINEVFFSSVGQCL